MRNWEKIGAIAAIAGVGVAAFAWLRPAGDDKDSNSATTSNGPSCIATGNATANCDYRAAEADAAKRDEADLLRDKETFADTKPTGKGPWQFIVVRDRDIGLKVRTTPLAEAVQIGGISTGHTAWVECQTHSGFDPEPTLGTNGLWYRLRWPSTEPGTDFRVSGYNDPERGWSFGYYLTPVGHNGDVPECDAN